jgi:disulfide bond formation protein DsbB
MTWYLIFAAWIVASVSTAGSLFFSEVMMYPPCILCWYQRICMYPMVLVLIAGLFPVDRNVIRFSMPLSLMGLGIAIYHNLLYYHILPESVAPCRAGISCTTVQIEWFGFVTIPLLSLLSFLIIVTLLIIARRELSHER